MIQQQDFDIDAAFAHWARIQSELQAERQDRLRAQRKIENAAIAADKRARRAAKPKRKFKSLAGWSRRRKAA